MVCFGFFCLVGLVYFVFKEEAFCIKEQFSKYFQVLQNPDKFCGILTGTNAKSSYPEKMTHTDTAAASLSKAAFKLVFDEASADPESQSNTRPTLNASSHLDCFMKGNKLTKTVPH